MKPKLRHKGSHHKKTVKLGEKSKPLTNCVVWICENQNANPREGKLGEQPLKILLGYYNLWFKSTNQIILTYPLKKF